MLRLALPPGRKMPKGPPFSEQETADLVFLQKIKEISPQDGSEVCKKNKIFQKIRIFIWLVTGKNVYLGHYNLA